MVVGSLDDIAGYEEERDLPIQISAMNDMEIWLRIKVNEDGEYIILQFGFEDRNNKKNFVDWELIHGVMTIIGILEITRKVSVHAEMDPAVDPDEQEEYEYEGEDDA